MKCEISIIKFYFILIFQLHAIYSFVDRIPRLKYKFFQGELFEI